jgi:hypothetical protein
MQWIVTKQDPLIYLLNIKGYGQVLLVRAMYPRLYYFN